MSIRQRKKHCSKRHNGAHFLAALCCVCFSSVLTAQSNFDVFEVSILELQDALEQGTVTSVDLVNLYLARIEAYDQDGPKLNSIIRINDQAVTLARELDRERQRTGPRGLLHGIPVIVKDNYNTTDMPTTGGSVALAGFLPSANATQVDKLIQAGAIVLAKSNLHEYAYGITSISSIVGQTRNPYDIRRVPGGSSGGTGAAIAASFAAVGMGSDTCGSIRIPSAFNNLIGLRPSKGISSIFGVMPLSHTQDVAGPLARSATDLAIVLDAVSGIDEKDPATEILLDQSLPQFFSELNSVSLDGIRFGRLQSYFDEADGPVRSVIEQALEWFENQGVEIVEIEIPELGDLTSSSGLIGHEFKSDLDQYLALFLSTQVSSLTDIVDLGLYHEAVNGPLSRSRAQVFNEDEYIAALAARGDLRQAIEGVIEENRLDAVIYPTIRELQVFTGESQGGSNCSLSANSGLPALSMPAGFTGAGLPVGLELLGEFLSDSKLLSVAYQFEQLNSARRAPSTTPELINGITAEPEIVDFSMSQQGVDLNARFTVDKLRNEFAYRLTLADTDFRDVYSVVLIIDDPEIFELNEPVVLNLMGPNRDQAEGKYFMSPAFRSAFEENRLHLKVFASGLPASGLSQSMISN
jgi:amidase